MKNISPISLLIGPKWKSAVVNSILGTRNQTFSRKPHKVHRHEAPYRLLIDLFGQKFFKLDLAGVEMRSVRNQLAIGTAEDKQTKHSSSTWPAVLFHSQFLILSLFLAPFSLHILVLAWHPLHTINCIWIGTQVVRYLYNQCVSGLHGLMHWDGLNEQSSGAIIQHPSVLSNYGANKIMMDATYY